MPITHDTSQLDALGAGLATAAVRAAVRVTEAVAETATDLEAEAKSICPVRTGSLRDSIGTDLAGLTATVGPTVDYAKYVEYGTSKMAPQPFMGPATDIVETRFAAKVEQAAEVSW